MTHAPPAPMLTPMIRIIAGKHRSRRLAGPENEAVSRPYLQRVKESVFNLLRGHAEGARVVDLYAGVGTMGLEAASRGASEVLMVERNRAIWKLLQQNIDDLDCSDTAVALCADALGPLVLQRAPEEIDLCFVDPPYPQMESDAGRAPILAQIERIGPRLAKDGFIVLRSPLGPDEVSLTIPGLAGPEAHHYGKSMWVLLYALSTEEAVEEAAAGPGGSTGDAS